MSHWGGEVRVQPRVSLLRRLIGEGGQGSVSYSASLRTHWGPMSESRLKREGMGRES